MQSVPLRVKKNLAVAEHLIEKVANDGAQLVVLPEMFNVGFYFGEELMAVAESLDGKTINWLKGLAVKKSIYITTSIYEYYKGHYYNTMVMVGSEGEVQYYRKRNPTWFEISVWRRGDKPGPGIFDTPFGRIGGVICFDSFSREAYYGFEQSGVDIIIIVACWGISKSNMWRPDVLLGYPALREWGKRATMAIPHYYSTKLQVPTILVNQGGKTQTPCETPWFYPFPSLENQTYEFCGKSSIHDATGKIVVQAKGSEAGYHAVEDVNVNEKAARPKIERIDIPNQYLKSSYYIVQPPIISKLFQALFAVGLQNVYEARRKKYETS